MIESRGFWETDKIEPLKLCPFKSHDAKSGRDRIHGSVKDILTVQMTRRGVEEA